MTVLSRWIPTGCGSLDRAFEGGLPSGHVSLLYGAAETGKTTLAMQCAVNSARMGFKTLYIDSDGTFSTERLSQVSSQDFVEVSDSVILVSPATFEEQVEIVDNLEKYVNKRFGLIICDTVTSLYRVELVSKRKTFNLNRELNRQVATLAQIAKTLDISVLMLSQVRSVPSEVYFVPVATRVLQFWSDEVVGLNRIGRRNIVKASVEKSGGKVTQLDLYLVIEEDGVHDYNQ